MPFIIRTPLSGVPIELSVLLLSVILLVACTNACIDEGLLRKPYRYPLHITFQLPHHGCSHPFLHLQIFLIIDPVIKEHLSHFEECCACK